MNKAIKLIRINGSYNIEAYLSSSIDLIYFFLCDDVSLWPDRWISHLYNPGVQRVSSNFTYFEKDNRGNVILGTKYEEDMNLGEIKCTVDQLVHLLKKWKEIQENKPKYITIAQENNGYFTITMADALS